jgi:Xaa-Pro aminopeptidase
MRLPDSDVLETRHARVRRTLEPLGLDALIVTTATNIRYLTNHTGSAGTLVLTADSLHLLVDSRYVTAVRARQQSTSACPSLRIWPYDAGEDDALMTCLRELGPRLAGFEAANLTVARHGRLCRSIESAGLGVALRATEDLVESRRAIKDPGEVAVLREAAVRLTGVAAAGFAAVSAGRTERAVAAAVESALRAAGFERPAFETIVASGPNSALPHHRAGERVLRDGDLVVLDFGGVLDGYCSDLTRTVSVGAPRADQIRVHDAVREAQRAALAAVRPGALASEVDGAARSVLEARGYGDAFGHGTGHGLGLDIHEAPRIGRRRAEEPDVTLEVGMVFTIEPGAYLPDWGGVRIEDDVLVTGQGCEVLTLVPGELLALNAQ